MHTYNGISISELRLLTHTLVFTILFLALLVALAILGYTQLSMVDKKRIQHLNKLREKAKSDDLAKKQLEKLERKEKRKQRRNKHNRIQNAVVWVLGGCLGLVLLGWAVIPGWTDYLKKDYVVYTGEIEVIVLQRHSHIDLSDGTTVWGRGDFDSDDSYGTVVYSKRTKQLVGTQK